MASILHLVRQAFHHPETRVYRVTQGVVWILIAASVALVAAELALPEDHPYSDLLERLDLGVLWIFAIELALRIVSYRPATLDFFSRSAPQRFWTHIWGRLLYCLRPMTMIDILTVAALVPGLRGLRALRLLRLIRTPKVFRYSQPFEGLARSIRENGLLFGFAFSLLGVAVLVGGVSIFLIERATNPDIQSVGDGLWWALTTITTVGFGDITPVTTIGRVVGAVIMIFGMFSLAMFAGIVGITLVRAVLSIREEQFRMSGYIDHIVICGYDAGARMLIDAVLEEVDLERQAVVIFAEGERPTDIPAQLTWVTGDPTKESELDKARLTHAAAAILVGSREVLPQQADATTILTAFTIRSYLANREVTSRRRTPLYLVAEILDSENFEHARSAGADEVIETTQLGFSLLAHAIEHPGTATLVGEVAKAGAHSIFVGVPPAGPGKPPTFGDLARKLKRESAALLLGVRLADGTDRINPPDNLPVTPELRLIYLAEGPVLPEE